MTKVRFWDSSALVKVFDEREADHRRALGLWSGPTARGVEHASSILVAIEALRKYYRAVPDQVSQLLGALKTMSWVALDAAVQPVGYELAKRSHASGADTSILACAIAMMRASPNELEFVTADADQKALAEAEGVKTIGLAL